MTNKADDFTWLRCSSLLASVLHCSESTHNLFFQWDFSDDDEEADDFIGVDQAKELLTDIIQRMDIMDMVHFDRWLKTMTIARDSFSG